MAILDTEVMTPDTTLPVPPMKNGKNGEHKAKRAKKAVAGGKVEIVDHTKKKAKKTVKAKKKNKRAAKAATGTKRGKAAKDELKFADMTKDEQQIVKFCFSTKGPRVAHKINDMQKEIFGKEKTGSSRTRNNLRRLVKFGWLEKADRGAYRLTEKGRKRGLNG